MIPEFVEHLKTLKPDLCPYCKADRTLFGCFCESSTEEEEFMNYFILNPGPFDFQVCYNRPGRKEVVVMATCSTYTQACDRIAELLKQERARSLYVKQDQRNRGFRP